MSEKLNYQIVLVLVRKNKFIKNQEVGRLLSILGFTTPLSNISLIGDILFQGTCFVLIIFEMVSLKLMKLLTIVCSLETMSYPNYI